MKIVILISGKQGSGKSTLARNLNDAILGSVIMKFATPLYDMHDAVREVALSYGLPMPVKDGPLLQVLGTNWGRQQYGKDIWVELLKNKILKSEESVFIIDDCRFPNELDISDSSFKVIKVRLKASEDVRRKRAEGWRSDTQHLSEIALDEIDDGFFDLVYYTEDIKPSEMVRGILDILYIDTNSVFCIK